MESSKKISDDIKQQVELSISLVDSLQRLNRLSSAL
jgi:hypothetical protein